MDLDQFTLMESNVFDIRFGNIEVYCQKDDDSQTIFTKLITSASTETHQEQLKLTINRMSKNHSNILTLIDFKNEPNQFNILQKYEYPDNDISERFNKLKSPKELSLFIRDMLSALSHLQSNQTECGNFRPEFIFHRPLDNYYVLVDRLGPNSDPFDSIRLFMINNEPNYASPEVFNTLIKEFSGLGPTNYKRDVFNLGMIVVSILAGRSLVEPVYDTSLKIFDERKFQIMCLSLDQKYTEPSGHKLIWNFLRRYILLTNPKNRLTPQSAFEKFEIYREKLDAGKVDFEETDSQSFFSKRLASNSSFELFEESFFENILVREPDEVDINTFRKTLDTDVNEIASEASLKRFSNSTYQPGHKFTFGHAVIKKKTMEAVVRHSEEIDEKIIEDARGHKKQTSQQTNSHKFNVTKINQQIIHQSKKELEKPDSITFLKQNEETAQKTELIENSCLKKSSLESLAKNLESLKTQQKTVDLRNSSLADSSTPLSFLNIDRLTESLNLPKSSNCFLNSEEQNRAFFKNSQYAKFTGKTSSNLQAIIFPNNNLKNFRNQEFNKILPRTDNPVPIQTQFYRYESSPQFLQLNQQNTKYQKMPINDNYQQLQQNSKRFRNTDKIVYVSSIPLQETGSNSNQQKQQIRSFTPILNKSPQMKQGLFERRSEIREHSQIKNLKYTPFNVASIYAQTLNTVPPNKRETINLETPKTISIPINQGLFKANKESKKSGMDLPIKNSNYLGRYQNSNSQSTIWVNVPKMQYVSK